MTINAVYFVNLVDYLIRRDLDPAYSWRDADLDECVAESKANPYRRTTTFGQVWRDNLDRAREIGGAFATAAAATKNFYTDLAWAVTDRNHAAHNGGDATTEVSVETAALLKRFATRAIKDDSSLLPLFCEINDAVRKSIESKGIYWSVTASVAQHIVGSLAHDGETQTWTSPNGERMTIVAEYPLGLTKREARAFWKFNNIRNRYAHTGRITARDRAWVAQYATRVGVEL